VTVPLISLGFMNRRGWTDPELGLNPFGVRIVTREYRHKPPATIVDHGKVILRVATDEVDHVNIMGNHEMILDVLTVALGKGHGLEDRIYSDIDELVAQVDFSKKKKKKRRRRPVIAEKDEL